MAVASKYNKYLVTPPAARVTLRAFAVAVHEQPGVADACVSLQDSFDVDVNILLCAAYIGAVRRRSVTSDELTAAHARVDAWHRDVVRPLRAVRRRLKTGPPPAPSAHTDEVRKQVAKAELDAELVELDVLGDWVTGLDDAPGTGTPSELARTAMEMAVRSCSAVPLDDDGRSILTVIADAAARSSEAAS